MYMGVLIKAFIISGLTPCALTTCVNSMLEYCLIQSERRVDEGIYDIYTSIGLQMCARECNSRRMCLAFNYDLSKLTCELIAKTSSTLVAGKPKVNPSFVFVDKSTCTQNYSLCGTIACPDNHKCIMLTDGSHVCIQSGCDPPSPVVSAAISPLSAVVSDAATYTCKDQCLLFGDPMITCAANSTWTSTKFQCKGCCTGDGYQFIEELNVCIKLYTTFKTWSEANDICTADSATLPIMYDDQFYSLTKAAIYDTVSALPYSDYATFLCSAQIEVWMGANDIEVEGAIKWLNGEAFSALQNVDSYTDNISCDLRAADCIIVNLSTNKFRDRNCHKEYPFFCVKSDLVSD